MNRNPPSQSSSSYLHRLGEGFYWQFFRNISLKFSHAYHRNLGVTFINKRLHKLKR